MTKTQSRRTKELQSILKKMGGRLDGNNSENYKVIAKATKSSVATVQSWIPNRVTKEPRRVISQIKLDALRGI